MITAVSKTTENKLLKLGYVLAAGGGNWAVKFIVIPTAANSFTCQKDKILDSIYVLPIHIGAIGWMLITMSGISQARYEKDSLNCLFHTRGPKIGDSYGHTYAYGGSWGTFQQSIHMVRIGLARHSQICSPLHSASEMEHIHHFSAPATLFYHWEATTSSKLLERRSGIYELSFWYKMDLCRHRLAKTYPLSQATSRTSQII